MAFVSLILGGARSGKSARALVLATARPRLFVATAAPVDAEMADRIARHKAERGPDWDLAEAPLDIAGAVGARAAGGVVLIDCLTLWLSNLLARERDLAAETATLIDALARWKGHAILVSNEVGMGLVPMTPIGRAFRDEQGRLNQRIAGAADHVEFVAAGLPIALKGAPPAPGDGAPDA